MTPEVVVAWFARQLRPDGRYAALAAEFPNAWKPDVVEYALAAALEMGRGDIKQIAGIMKRLADGDFGRTESPRRILYSKGNWWGTIKPAPRPRAGERKPCREPGHFAQPADNCKLCVVDSKVSDEEPPLPPNVDPVEAAARAEAILARRGRRRVGATA